MKWSPTRPTLVGGHIARLGIGPVRVTFRWSPGRSEPRGSTVLALRRADETAAGRRLVVAVYIVIWNEPNSSRFWRPQFTDDGASAASRVRAAARRVLGRPPRVPAEGERDRRERTPRQRRPVGEAARPSRRSASTRSSPPPTGRAVATGRSATTRAALAGSGVQGQGDSSARVRPGRRQVAAARYSGCVSGAGPSLVSIASSLAEMSRSRAWFSSC
jgi:hypothetical protein